MERRAEAFSISRVALNAGNAIGPGVALALLARDPSFRLNFIASTVICAGFLVIVLTMPVMLSDLHGVRRRAGAWP